MPPPASIGSDADVAHEARIGTGGGARVLVVEDAEHDQILIKACLSENYHVSVASNTREAMELAGTKLPVKTKFVSKGQPQ